MDAETAPSVVKYQFDIEDGLWDSWKDTVPRSKSLDTRLRELIEADRDGRVRDEQDTSHAPTHEEDTRPTPEVDADTSESAPSHGDLLAGVYDDMADPERRRSIGQHALDWLSSRESHKSASDFKQALYDADRREGESDDTWWRKNVRPALQAAVGVGVVEYRDGHHDYGWVGEDG